MVSEGDGMTPELWLFLFLGGWIGYFVGRTRAEHQRARFDMRKMWNGRQDYRK